MNRYSLDTSWLLPRAQPRTGVGGREIQEVLWNCQQGGESLTQLLPNAAGTSRAGMKVPWIQVQAAMIFENDSAHNHNMM